MNNTLIINTKSKRDNNGNSLIQCEIISTEENHGYTCNMTDEIMNTLYNEFGIYIVRRNQSKNIFTIYSDNLKEFKQALSNYYNMTVLSHEVNL